MPEGTLERIWAEARRLKEQGLPGTPVGPLPTGPTVQFPDQPKPHERPFSERILPEGENRLFTAVAAPIRTMAWLGDQESKYITEPAYGFLVKMLAKQFEHLPRPVRENLARGAQESERLPAGVFGIPGEITRRVLLPVAGALADDELRQEVAESSSREAYQKIADRSGSFYWTTQLASPVNIASLGLAAVTGGTSLVPSASRLLGRAGLTGAKAAQAAGKAAQAAEAAGAAAGAGRSARMARGMTQIGRPESAAQAQTIVGAARAGQEAASVSRGVASAAQGSRTWQEVRRYARVVKIPFDIYDETYAVLLRPYIWVTKDLVGKPLWWGVKTVGRPLLRPIRSLFERSSLSKRIQETRIFGSLVRRNLRQAGRPFVDDAEAYMQAEIEAIRTGEISMDTAGDPQLLRYYQRTGDEEARKALFQRGLVTPEGKLLPEAEARLRLDDALIRNGRFGGAERTFAQQILDLVFQVASAANPERSPGEIWRAINVENVADGSLLRGEITRKTVKKGKKQFEVYNIRLGKDADITTLAHEFAHLIDFLAPETFRNVLLRHFGETTSTGAKVWTDRSAERFALAFEQWLFTGRSSIPALDNLMKIFRDQAEASYFRAQPGVDMPDEVARAIEDLLASWRRGEGPGPDDFEGRRPGPEPGPGPEPEPPPAPGAARQAEEAAQAAETTVGAGPEPVAQDLLTADLDVEKLTRQIYARKLGQAMADLATRVQSETARRLLLPNLTRRLWQEARQEAEAIVRQARAAGEAKPKRAKVSRKAARAVAQEVPVQTGPDIPPETPPTPEPMATAPEPPPPAPEPVMPEPATVTEEVSPVRKRLRRALRSEQAETAQPQAAAEPVPTQPEPTPIQPEPAPVPQTTQQLVDIYLPSRDRRQVSEVTRDLYYRLLRSFDDELVRLANTPSPVPGVAGRFHKVLSMARELGGDLWARRLAQYIREQLASRYGDAAPQTVERIGKVLDAADRIPPSNVRSVLKRFFDDFRVKERYAEVLEQLPENERGILRAWSEFATWGNREFADRLQAVADRLLDDLRPAIEAEEASALARPAVSDIPADRWPNPTADVRATLQKLEKASGKRKPKGILQRDMPVVTVWPDGTYRTTTRAFAEFYQEFIQALGRRLSEELGENLALSQTFAAKLFRQRILSPEAMRDLFVEVLSREGTALDPNRLQSILSLIDRYRQAGRNPLKSIGSLESDRTLRTMLKELGGEEKELAKRLLSLDVTEQEADFLVQRALDRVRTSYPPALFRESVQDMAQEVARWNDLPSYHPNYAELLAQEGETLPAKLLGQAVPQATSPAVSEPAGVVTREAGQEVAAPATPTEPEPVTPARAEEPDQAVTEPTGTAADLSELDQWAVPKLADGSEPSAEFADSFETAIRLFANDFIDAVVEDIAPRIRSLAGRRGRAAAKEPVSLPVDSAAKQAITTIQKLGLTDPDDLARVVRGAALQFLIYGYRDLAFQLVKELEPFLSAPTKKGSTFQLLQNVVKKVRKLAAKRAGVKSFEEIPAADHPEWLQEVTQFEGDAAERALLRGAVEGDPAAWPWANIHKLLSDALFESLARFLPDMDLAEELGVFLPVQKVDAVGEDDVARIFGLSSEGMKKLREERAAPAQPVQPARAAQTAPPSADVQAPAPSAGQAVPTQTAQAPAATAPTETPVSKATRETVPVQEPPVPPEQYRLTTDIGQGIKVGTDGTVTVGERSLKLRNEPGHLTARHVRELVRLARKLGTDDPLETVRKLAAEVVEGVDDVQDLADLTDADLDQVFRYVYTLMAEDRAEAQILAKAAKRVNELRDRLLGRTTMTLGRISRESRRILTDALRANYLFDSEPLRFDPERAKQVIQEVMRSGRLRPTDQQFLSKFNERAGKTNWEQLVTELEDIAGKVSRGEPLRLTTSRWVQSWQPDELEDRLAFALSTFPRLPLGNEAPVERDLIDLMYQALREKGPGRIASAIAKARKRILDLPESMVLEIAKRIGPTSLEEYLGRVLPDILSDAEKSQILSALQSRLGQVSASWNSDKVAEYLGTVMSEIIPKEGMVLAEIGREIAMRLLRERGLTVPQDTIRAALEKLLGQGTIRYEGGKIYFKGTGAKVAAAPKGVNERVAQTAAKEIWQQASSMVQSRGDVLAQLTAEEIDTVGSALAYVLKQRYRGRGWPSSTLSGRLLLRQVTERLKGIGAPVRQELAEKLSLSDLEEIGIQTGILEPTGGTFRPVWELIDEAYPDDEMTSLVVQALGREPDIVELDLGRAFGHLAFQEGRKRRIERLTKEKVDSILQRIVDEFGHIRRGQPLGPLDLRKKLEEMRAIVPLRSGEYRIDWGVLDDVLDLWKKRNAALPGQTASPRPLSQDAIVRLLKTIGGEPPDEAEKAARKAGKKSRKAKKADQTLQQDVSLRTGAAFVPGARERPLDIGRFRLREDASLQDVLDAIAVRHGGIRPEQVDRVAERIQRAIGGQTWFPFTSLLIDETAEQAILRAMRDEKVADRAIAEALSRMGMKASAFGVAHPALHKVLRTVLPNQFGLPRAARGSAILASGRSLTEREAEILARARSSEKLQRLAESFERDRELIGQSYDRLRSLLGLDHIPAWDPDKLTVGDVWKVLDLVPADAPVDVRNVADQLRKTLTEWDLLPKKKRPVFSRSYADFLNYKIDEVTFRTDLDESMVRKASAIYFDELGKIYKVKPTYLERLVEVAVPESVRRFVGKLGKAWRQLAVLSAANVMRNVQDIFVRAHLYGFGNQLRGSESAFHRAQAWELGGLPGVMIEPFYRIRSATEEFEAPTDLLFARFLRKFGKAGEVPAELLQWMADNRWEIIAISESAARGAAWKTFAEQHFAENVLPALLRRIREAGIDPEVIRRIEAEGLDLSPTKLREILLGAGVNRNRAEELVTVLRAGIAEADRVGTQKAYQIFFDYEDVTRLEQELGLNFWLPFHYWATRNVPFYLDTLSSHPRLLAFLVRYESASRRFREDRGLPGRFSFMIPFSIGGRYFGVNPFAIFSIFDQFRSYPELDSEDGVLQQLYEFIGTIGVSPSPFVMIPLERAGLVEGKFDARLVPRLTQWVQLGTALAGLNQGRGYDPEAPILRVLTGEDPDAYRQRLVRRRLREMSIERTGRPDTPEYQWAMLDPSSPLYQEALRDVNAYLARRQLVNFFVGLPTAEAGPTEVQVSQRRSQYPEELTPEMREYLARTGDIGTAYWGVRQPEQVQVNLGFLLDRNMMPGWQHYYADEIEERIPGYRSYLEWLANRGPGQSRSVQTWLRETGRR